MTLEIIDAHHHLWELSRFPYKWLAPEAPPRRFGDHTPIKRDYLPTDYRADFADHTLLGSVHVQANCGAADPVDETQWLQSLADTTGLPSVIVAEADLCRPDAADLIDRHAQSPLMRGVRALVAHDTAGQWRFADRPGVMGEAVFRDNAATLAARGLSLDLLIAPEQLPEVAELAAALPELPIAINHFAQLEPNVPGLEATWRAGMETLRPYENVAVKISGLWTVDRTWQPDVLRPFLEHGLATLGAARLMYGSNLPVEKVNTSAERQIEVLSGLLGTHGPDTMARIFAQTAKSFYRIE